MSDTTGWEKGANCRRKKIGGLTFYCFNASDGNGFELWIGNTQATKRDTPEECQRLAHDTARLWAGESE